ncbi:ADP-ribose pyrophosphatase, mitochondrial [Hypsibius exemplaris]|uniref:ADP-ribose pyrophosphatase, mitochondrial n=1 Tax=Hypsibius exemplaris TaxID=2072580 RepID=A0A9X6NMU0_HYPEX|nr:ADP-ribose pyrophosphatase, mitochondrial [Hypsibius exemplaris]
MLPISSLRSLHLASVTLLPALYDRGAQLFARPPLRQSLAVPFFTTAGTVAAVEAMEKKLHSRCLQGTYPGSSVQRLTVPDDKICWDAPWQEYDPPVYTAESLKDKPYADPDVNDPKFRPRWNSLDDDVDRRSHIGQYTVVNGVPQNPIGRTGLRGRGRLGRWAVNHAGDPIVTRWKTDKNGNVMYSRDEDKPILQFVAIERQSGNEWAFPGGMTDPGESPEETVEREFFEEALEGKGATDKVIEHNRRLMEDHFRDGVQIYRGYVDDPRNTDNAWMETVAINYHDNSGSHLAKLKLVAGSDAKSAEWKDATADLKLYASHSEILSSPEAALPKQLSRSSSPEAALPKQLSRSSSPEAALPKQLSQSSSPEAALPKRLSRSGSPEAALPKQLSQSSSRKAALPMCQR